MGVVITGPGTAAPAGPAGVTKDVPVPTRLVQIVHNLPFVPAGVLCTDASGIAEPEDVTYPLPGVVEVAFGAPFSGTIRLS